MGRICTKKQSLWATPKKKNSIFCRNNKSISSAFRNFLIFWVMFFVKKVSFPAQLIQRTFKSINMFSLNTLLWNQNVYYCEIWRNKLSKNSPAPYLPAFISTLQKNSNSLFQNLMYTSTTNAISKFFLLRTKTLPGSSGHYQCINIVISFNGACN